MKKINSTKQDYFRRIQMKNTFHTETMFAIVRSVNGTTTETCLFFDHSRSIDRVDPISSHQWTGSAPNQTRVK